MQKENYNKYDKKTKSPKYNFQQEQEFNQAMQQEEQSNNDTNKNEIDLMEIEKEFAEELRKANGLLNDEFGYRKTREILQKVFERDKCPGFLLLLSHYQQKNGIDISEENRVSFLVREATRIEDVEMLECIAKLLEAIGNTTFVLRGKKINTLYLVPIETIYEIVNESLKLLKSNNENDELIEVLAYIRGLILNIKAGEVCVEDSAICTIQRIENYARKIYHKCFFLDNYQIPQTTQTQIDENQKAVIPDVEEAEETQQLQQLQPDLVELEEIKKEIEEKIENAKKELEQNIAQISTKIENINIQPTSQTAPQQPQQTTQQIDVRLIENAVKDVVASVIQQAVQQLDNKIALIQENLEEVKKTIKDYIEEEEELLSKYQRNDDDGDEE
ncbi:hypothetical protein [Caminibacter pacificus]|uniref:Uncharacterized protein n=1 Tax=Caminibacter pacificus TaxID=1424653 RepID=A0AAJ4RBD5_9BACT|nr:hypothetical protein [Caminibacter pacificus]QDD68144.1 hypothetical protein C6V80_09835 [Caminibacter pacificus]ROR38762.1 hypothetical protein EDC58_1977 [Caminibacter pacificus]